MSISLQRKSHLPCYSSSGGGFVFLLCCIAGAIWKEEFCVAQMINDRLVGHSCVNIPVFLCKRLSAGQMATKLSNMRLWRLHYSGQICPEEVDCRGNVSHSLSLFIEPQADEAAQLYCNARH